MKNYTHLTAVDDTDEIILQQLRSGDIRAYEHFFKHFYKPLVAKALYILNDQMDAEDIVQVIFIEFWNKKHYLNIKNSLTVYLNRAVKNRCLNLLQTREIRARRTRQLAGFLDNSYQENRLEKAADYEFLQMGLASLSVQQLNAFNLIHAENKKYKEAAKEMGISINSLKTHLKIAVKTLRRYLIKSN